MIRSLFGKRKKSFFRHLGKITGKSSSLFSCNRALHCEFHWASAGQAGKTPFPGSLHPLVILWPQRPHLSSHPTAWPALGAGDRALGQRSDYLGTGPTSVMTSFGTSACPTPQSVPTCRTGVIIMPPGRAVMKHTRPLDMAAWHRSGHRGTSVTSLPPLFWKARLPAPLGSHHSQLSMNISGHNSCPLDVEEQGLGEKRVSLNLRGPQPDPAKDVPSLPPTTWPWRFVIKLDTGSERRADSPRLGVQPPWGAAPTCPSLPGPGSGSGCLGHSPGH